MVCLQAAPRAVLTALVKLLGEPLLQQADAARVPGLLATLISTCPTLLVRKTPFLATGTQASTGNRQVWRLPFLIVETTMMQPTKLIAGTGSGHRGDATLGRDAAQLLVLGLPGNDD